jgi:hypothetical protein
VAALLVVAALPAEAAHLAEERQVAQAVEQDVVAPLVAVELPVVAGLPAVAEVQPVRRGRAYPPIPETTPVRTPATTQAEELARRTPEIPTDRRIQTGDGDNFQEDPTRVRSSPWCPPRRSLIY